MIKEYTIKGMTCNACVASVRENLLQIDGIKVAIIQLESPQAVLSLNKNISTTILNQAIGKYEISDLIKESTTNISQDLPEVSVNTYKPLLLIVGFLIGISALSQYPFEAFSLSLWMRHFMAGFFLAFSFFKLLNLSGFADSFAMYDIIASRWKTWGFIFPFVELGLGIAYLINFNPLITNITTLVFLITGTIGVVQSNLNKRKIKCACLGDVFNLPMSTVTIIENVTMIVMASLMLLCL